MTDKSYHVFLSHSRNDPVATADLAGQLRRCGLEVFKDDENIQPGDEWTAKLQSVLERCGAFVVLVGRDGVRRWIGAETQVALNRYFGPHDDAQRLPIFPILLDGIEPETLPAFLRLFQVTRWNGGETLPEGLLANIRDRNILRKAEPIAGCPFVGLAAYRPEQAHLFFGRQKETLAALACFRRRPKGPQVKWLEINGNSGSGKSSLMQAGLLPLIRQGWLWPRTGYEHWQIIGPMMPGAHPVRMLAEVLTRGFKGNEPGLEMPDVRKQLEVGDESVLAEWLRGRKQDGGAFLLAIDQFEELFTFAEENERKRFDRLLAAALNDPDCPLFVMSTVRSDFFDRFADDLPRLVALKNQLGKPWTLEVITRDGLREVIEGPAALAGLNAGEVREMMVKDAEDEPGSLPLVENALHWLWGKLEGNLLSGAKYNDHGGLGGILKDSADALLKELSDDDRARALELLFQLVKVDDKGRRHARKRLPREKAIEIADGLPLFDCLRGTRTPLCSTTGSPTPLITVDDGGVSLIHDTLIRKGPDKAGEPQPYWPMLWDYIEQHIERGVWLRRLEEDVPVGDDGRSTGHQWSQERVVEAVTALTAGGREFKPSEKVAAFLGPYDRDAMCAAIESNETSHRDRALIGERFAMFRFSREGDGLDKEDGLPDIRWEPIDGGEVTIEIREENFGNYNARADPVDYITRPVAPFWMARYPVTITQFSAFLAECLQGADWKLPSGTRFGVPEKDFPPELRGRLGNQPVDCVNWYEAYAFCDWLSARGKNEVRLPTEFEWQYAATGGDTAFEYPWGTKWDPVAEPWFANTSESGLGRPTAVGLYPQGKSRFGTMDMAGTVWEWCLNGLERPDETEMSVSSAPRVLRGGTWFLDKRNARSKYRYWYKPDLRSSDFGFRVVCSHRPAGWAPEPEG